MKKIPLGRLSLLVIAFPITLALFAGLYGGFGSAVMMLHLLNENTNTERLNLALKLESLVNRKVNQHAETVLGNLTQNKTSILGSKKNLIFKNYWHYSSKNSLLNISDATHYKLASSTFNFGQLSNYFQKASTNKEFHKFPTLLKQNSFASEPFIFNNTFNRFVIFPDIHNQQAIYFGLTIDKNGLETNIIQPLLKILTSSFYHASLKDKSGKIIASTGSERLKKLPIITSNKLTGLLSNYELEIRGKDKPFALPSKNIMLLGILGVFMVMISALGFILYLYWFGRTTEDKLK